MFSLLTIVLLSSDADTHPIFDHQEDLMRSFFFDIHRIRLLEISNNDPRSPVCGWPDGPNWKGVLNQVGTITCVFCYTNPPNRSKFDGNFHIGFLPNTVAEIRIRYAMLALPVKTRHLPRECQDIDLQYNHIPGSIDFHTLPLAMITFNMAHNRLHGHVTLTKLPRTMQMISLMHNKFEQSVLYYDDIPEGMRSVFLYSSGIEKVNPLNEANEMEQTIFSDI